MVIRTVKLQELDRALHRKVEGDGNDFPFVPLPVPDLTITYIL